jgi:hypothetical protein
VKDVTDVLRVNCDAVALIVLLLSLAMGVDRAVARLFAEEIAGPARMAPSAGERTPPCPETVHQ